MTSNTDKSELDIRVKGIRLETVRRYCHLGSIIYVSDDGYKPHKQNLQDV